MLEFEDDEGVELERRNRIRLSIAAYVYEFEDGWFMDDAEYDRISYAINTEVATGHPVMDEFFRTKFSPETGQWIHDHPEKDKLILLIQKIRNIQENTNGLRKTQKRPQI